MSVSRDARRGRTHRRPMRMTARRAEQAFRVAEKTKADATKARASAVEAIGAIRDETARRLGIALPSVDGFTLDVLAQIDVDDTGAWRWAGMRNNHGTPVVRPPRSYNAGDSAEWSAARFIGIALGFIKADDAGSFYPANGDAENLDPRTRVLRRAGTHANQWSGWAS